MGKLKSKRIRFHISEDKLNRLSVEESQYYIHTVEKQLDDSVDTGKLITERASNMFGLTSGIVIALSAYSIGKWEENHTWDILIRMSLIGSFIFFLMSLLLLYLIFPTTYCISGSRPEIIFRDELWDPEFNAQQRPKNLSINLLGNYQTNIMENNDKNTKRWMLYKIVIVLMVIIPLLFAATYLLF